MGLVRGAQSAKKLAIKSDDLSSSLETQIAVEEEN